jgi:hypothetical protein
VLGQNFWLPQKALLVTRPRLGGSAQPRLANDAGDLFSDQSLDYPGEVFVEPSLQQRPEHIAHDVFESATDTSERKLALPASLSR